MVERAVSCTWLTLRNCTQGDCWHRSSLRQRTYTASILPNGARGATCVQNSYSMLDACQH